MRKHDTRPEAVKQYIQEKSARIYQALRATPEELEELLESAGAVLDESTHTTSALWRLQKAFSAIKYKGN